MGVYCWFVFVISLTNSLPARNAPYAKIISKEDSIMASYETKNIRNVALMGHGSEGKTTLMEALLFAAGAIDRQGRTEDGNTVTDFEAEEIKRKISISAAVAPIDWNQKMINVIDVPGSR